MEERPLLESSSKVGRRVSLQQPYPKTTTPPLSSWRALLYLTWFWSLVYAAFIVIYYGTTWWQLRMEAWNWEGGHAMYVEESPRQSRIFLWMIFGPGVYMLILGPLQFVPSLRQIHDKNNVRLHAWMGRATLLASLLTAVGGMSYLILVKGDQTLRPTLLDHGNFATFIFGILVLICTIETYRHAAWTKQMQVHRRWAYRLAALQVGNLLFRLSVTTLTLLLPRVWTGQHGNLWASVTAWSFFVPNLILVEWYLRCCDSRKQPRQQPVEQSKLSMTSSHVSSWLIGMALGSLFVMGLLTSWYLWLPGISWCLNYQDELFSWGTNEKF